MSALEDSDILAFKEEDIWEEAKERLKTAQDAEGEDRARAKADLQFREGDQWDSPVITTASQETPELVINLTDALVRRVVNNMKQQRPRGKCHPVGDGADIDIAHVINGIGRHVETRSDASVAYDTAGEMAVTIGWGYWRIVSEYVAPDSFQQDLKILPIRNVFTVYMDPGALLPTAADADWAIISIKMKRTEYKRRYPNAENVSWTYMGRDRQRLDWENKEEIRLAEYFRIREIPQKLYQLKDAKGQEFIKYERDMPAKESLAAAGLEIIGERDSAVRQVEWFRLNGVKVVDRKILPGTYIPIIRCEGNAIDIDGEVHRRGMVRAMMDPQRMVNYGEVAKIRRLGLTPQAPWVAAEGQLDGHPEWTDSNRTPYAALTYKPVTIQTAQGEIPLPPPQRQPPAQLEAGFSEFTQGMRSNLMSVAGMPNEPGQDANGEVVSGIALRKRQYLSDQSHFQYYDNQVLAIAHTWKIMLEWIPHYYSEERMQRIIGEDGIPQLIKINQQVQEDGVSKVKNDLTVGRYDVVMETGPGFETRREEGAEVLMELVNSTALGPEIAKVGPDLILRTLDHPYMQELADRFAAQTPDGLQKIVEGLPPQAKSVVQALSAQIQQLQQQLEESEKGLPKAQLDAQTRKYEVDKRTDADLQKAGIESITRRDVAEIDAGSRLIDSLNVKGAEKITEGTTLINRGENH